MLVILAGYTAPQLTLLCPVLDLLEISGYLFGERGGWEIISLDYSAWYVNWLMINIFLTLNGQGEWETFPTF